VSHNRSDIGLGLENRAALPLAVIRVLSHTILHTKIQKSTKTAGYHLVTVQGAPLDSLLVGADPFNERPMARPHANAAFPMPHAVRESTFSLEQIAASGSRRLAGPS
jgi:hypothetical protein